MTKREIYKRAIVDGYLKIFDLMGNQPFGRTKYKDFKYEELMTYYKLFDVSMIVSFLLVVCSMILIVYSIAADSIVSTPMALFFYFVVFSPMFYNIIRCIKGLITNE